MQENGLKNFKLFITQKQHNVKWKTINLFLAVCLLGLHKSIFRCWSLTTILLWFLSVVFMSSAYDFLTFFNKWPALGRNFFILRFLFASSEQARFSSILKLKFLQQYFKYRCFPYFFYNNIQTKSKRKHFMQFRNEKTIPKN